MTRANKLLTLVSVVLGLIIYPIIVFPDNNYIQNGIIGFTIRILGDLFLMGLISLILSAVGAIIPIKSKTYVKKLISILPSILFVVLLVFSSMLYLNEPINYDEIEQPESLNCAELQQGEFTCNNLTIKRTLDKQIEINRQTNEVNEYRIKWIANCEYELIGINGRAVNYKVKIVEITDNRHKVYVRELGRNNAQILEIISNDGS